MRGRCPELNAALASAFAAVGVVSMTKAHTKNSFSMTRPGSAINPMPSSISDAPPVSVRLAAWIRVYTSGNRSTPAAPMMDHSAPSAIRVPPIQ